MRNSTEIPQINPNDNLSDSEREITEAVIRAKELGEKVGHDFGIGFIDISMPNALYNYLCYIISYHTGTGVIHVKELSLFDFISFLYIIQEVNKQKSGDMPNTPQGRDEKEMMGL